MKFPFLSIVTPTLNRFDYLKRLENSLLIQIYRNYEWIVIDNGSNDATVNYFQKKSIQHENIILLNCKKKGAGNARNVGIKYARGKYILLIDSDNYLLDKFSLLSLSTELEASFPCALFMKCVDNNMNQLTKFEGSIKAFSFVDYITKIRGEHTVCIESEWFKLHLYESISGIHGEMSWLVWINLYKEKKTVKICDLNLMVYCIDAPDRVSLMYSHSKLNEMYLYYFLFLLRNFSFLLNSSPKFALQIFFKCSIYCIASDPASLPIDLTIPKILSQVWVKPVKNVIRLLIKNSKITKKL